MFIQKLWLQDLEWDDELPPSQLKEWTEIHNTITFVKDISIPRAISYNEHFHIELHGFSDASINAFAAVVYSRVTQPDGTHKINLLTAKSRVAPIKQLTIAKLELARTHLLSKLLSKTLSDLKININCITAWTDSSIVLQWMRCQPNRLQTFLANRVSDILNNKDINSWRHVPGVDNPADCASRGIDPRMLINHPLWWTGPAWLEQSHSSWPKNTPTILDDVPEVKTTTFTIIPLESEITSLIESHSSLNRLIRTTAYIFRFIHNIKNSTKRLSGLLSAKELQAALKQLIISTQKSTFSTDYENLLKNRGILSSSNLKSLHPFINENIIRVGGRLQNSNLLYSAKHPIILPKNNQLTKLIVNQMHLNTLHGGPQLVMSMLHRKYWIINMRNIIRNEIHKRVKCFRYNATRCTQLMGNLPKPRVTIDRAFTHTSVDCAVQVQ